MQRGECGARRAETFCLVPKYHKVIPSTYKILPSATKHHKALDCKQAKIHTFYSSRLTAKKQLLST